VLLSPAPHHVKHPAQTKKRKFGRLLGRGSF